MRALQWLRGIAPYPFPTSIHYNLTLRCTARCVHCLQWSWPGHSELTISRLEKLVNIFASWGVQTITLGGGNPLLYRHLRSALQLFSQANIQVGIITEGIDMTGGLTDTISEYVQWIRFSLDGPTPQIHDHIRNRPGLFDCVIKGIEELRSRAAPPTIGLNCVIQKANWDLLPQMMDLAENIGVDVLLFKLPHGEDQAGRFLPSAEEWTKVVEFVHSAAEKEGGRVMTNLKELDGLFGGMFRTEDVVRGKPISSFYIREHVRCFTPLFFLTCDSEGNMYPCDYLQADTRQWGGKYGDMRNEFCLGNVLEDDRQVLDNLAAMLRTRVHELPGSGYDECGSCTRFCQLNASLTNIDRETKSRDITIEALTELLGRLGSQPSQGSFL